MDNLIEIFRIQRSEKVLIIDICAQKSKMGHKI